VARLLGREGPEDATRTIVVIEAVERPAARTRPPPADHLDTQPFVGGPVAAATTVTARIMVTVDGKLVELPHDDRDAMRDFVECVYVLHGWPGIDAIALELGLMLLLRGLPERLRAVVDRLGDEAPEWIRSVLPGSGPTPALARDPSIVGRYFELRDRTAFATTLQIAGWSEAFSEACADWRQEVLRRMRSLERAAVVLASRRARKSRATVLSETQWYFQWKTDRDAEAALDAHETGTVVGKRERVKELRTRLAKLEGLAEAVVKAEDELHDAKMSHARAQPPGGVVLPDRNPEIERREAVLEQKLGEYGAALAIQACEYPVLYRFNARTLLGAIDASDEMLGVLVFTRLKRTWEAATELPVALRRQRVAAAVADAEVKEGARPENLVGEEAKGSVWAYPKLLEKTLERLWLEDHGLIKEAFGGGGIEEDDRLLARAGLSQTELEVMRVSMANTRVAMARHASEEAVIEIAEGIALGGLSIAVTAVCPPAGLALDIGLSAADIRRSVSDFESAKHEALCDLDPRESLGEEEPSAVPVVMSVAGASMLLL
jgi:hypothetical protein